MFQKVTDERDKLLSEGAKTTAKSKATKATAKTEAKATKATTDRTETFRARHIATIQEYRNWAVEGVKVKAEWITAEDGRVCDKCAALQNKVFELDEIESMIPLHSDCRCCAIPVDVTDLME